MAEVVSGRDLTVIVLDQREAKSLAHLLDLSIFPHQTVLDSLRDALCAIEEVSE